MEISDIPITTATLFVTFQLGFILCLGLSLIENPSARKWYSTATGLFLGFYFHGLSYFVCIFHFSCIYPLMKFLPRESALYPVVFLSALVMSCRSFYSFWESNIDGSARLQCTVIFMRTHMAMCNYEDAGKIDDPVKGNHLLPYERELAEPFRQLPSYMEWFHYHCFAPLAYIGENVSYAKF